MNKEKISKEIHRFMNDLPYEGGYPSDWQDRLANHLYNQFRQAAVTPALPLPYLCPACDGECSVTHEPVYKCGVCHGIFGGNDR